MSKFPIIFGIIGKKIYLTILLALIMILYFVFKRLIPEEESISIINKLGGSVIEMLSIFIPYIFKFKSKFEKSSRKCTKANFKDYFILFLIVLSYTGTKKLIEYLDIKAQPISNTWIFPFYLVLCNLFLTIIMLKEKYYVHNFICIILCCIFRLLMILFLEISKILKYLVLYIYFLIY